MKVIRFLADLILAAILTVVCVAVVLLAYGRAMEGSWEITAASAEEGAWAWVGEQPLYYRTWGPEDGAPLVLVPGLDVGASALWAPLVTPLGRAGYRVIAVDLPPLGHSSRDTAQDLSVLGQADALSGVLEQLGVQGATVVAQGWGSMVAVQVALDQPQLVQGLILVGPAREANLYPYEHSLVKAPWAGNATAWLVRGGGPIWKALLRYQVAGASDEYRAYLKAARASSQIEGTTAALVALYGLDPAGNKPVAIESLRIPCVIVRGAQDHFVSEEQVAALADELDADVRTIEDAGHLVVLDQPEALRKVILEALQP